MAYAKRSDALAASKRHYENNKAKYLARNRLAKEEAKKWFQEYKKTLRCAKCGENDPVVLDFHHLDPRSKDFEVGKAVRYGSIRRIEKEVAKCAVLCANCHRRVHATNFDGV